MISVLSPVPVCSTITASIGWFPSLMVTVNLEVEFSSKVRLRLLTASWELGYCSLTTTPFPS